MECERFFCRECVTEHDDRLICASCLKKVAGAAQQRTHRLVVFTQIGQLVAGILVAWLFFYLMGRTLLLIPTSFHDGTVWESPGDER